jgi:TonB family protein
MANTALWKAWEGRVVDGRFPLRKWLGGSDHSAVFLTELGRTQTRKAAIKLVAARVSDDAHLSRWRAAARRSHPHLAHIFEVGRCEFDGTTLLFLVTEYAEEDLSQILPHRPLTPAETRALLPPVLDALDFLHGQGLVHGRIQPSNIFAVDNQVKLSAENISTPGPSTLDGVKPNIYNAPELAAGKISSASDVWSLGITLVAVLTQHAPTSQQLELDPPVPANIPQPFRSIARNCLRRDPQQRPSIAELRTQLQPDSTLVRMGSKKTPVAKRRFGIRTVLPAALLLLAAVVGIKLFTRSDSSPPPASSSSQQQPAVSAPPVSSPITTAKPHEQPKKTSPSSGEVVRQVIPEVPKSARNTIHGKIPVKVRVEVDPSGKVKSARLVSPGPSKYFASLALKAAQQWQFKPPEAQDQQTSNTWILRFQFGRASTEVVPMREHL